MLLFACLLLQFLSKKLKMTFQIAIVLIMLVAMLAALIADRMRPGMILFSVLVVFLCVGIITPKEMLEGFSNKGMITVALLFLVSEGVRQSGALTQVIKKVLPQGQTTVFKAQVRMLPSIAFISAFLPESLSSHCAGSPPPA